MAAVWRLGEATVEDVRAEQHERQRSAYTTMQTVLNRLVERGLLERQRRGKAFVYRATSDESQLLVDQIGDRLDQASPDARRAALVGLVGRLDEDDLDEVARYANRVRRARQKD